MHLRSVLLSIGLAIGIASTALAGDLKTVTSIAVGEPAYRIAVTPDGVTALATTPTTRTLSFINVATAQLTTTLTLPGVAQEIAITSDGDQALVLNNSDQLTVVDLGSALVVGSPITLDLPGDNAGFAVLPDNRTILIAHEAFCGTSAHCVAVLRASLPGDWNTLQIVGEIPVGMGPRMVVVSGDGTLAFVPCGNSGTVSVLHAPSIADWNAAQVIKTFDIGGQPSGLALSPDGRTALVVNQDANSVDILQASSPGTWAEGIWSNSVPVTRAARVAFMPDSARAIATQNDGYWLGGGYMGAAHLLEVSSPSAWGEVHGIAHSVPMSGIPFDVAVAQPGTRVFVARYIDGVVDILDLACGDGVVDPGEQCDDGNLVTGDGCNSECRIEGGSTTSTTATTTTVPTTTTTTTTLNETTTTTLGDGECGDLDGDGDRDVTDALQLLQAAVGMGSCPLLLCDVTGDGIVSAGDALALLQFAVGLRGSLECAPATTTTTTTLPSELRLRVLLEGSGTGTVTSTPPGIDCGSQCQAYFPYATPVTLSALPASGSIFSGWTAGACTGSEDCILTMKRNRTTTARFDTTTTTTTTTTSTTKSTTTTSTTTTTKPAPRCGDGAVNQGSEQCDGSDLNGKTCKSLGYNKGTLSCRSNCTFNDDRCIEVASWVGYWDSYYEDASGVINAKLEMDAFGFKGTISVSGSPCFDGGTIEGEIVGTTVTSGAVLDGGHIAYFDGQLVGDCMYGDYETYGPKCGGDRGEWRLCR